MIKSTIAFITLFTLLTMPVLAMAQNTAKNPETYTSAENLEEYLTGLYSELMKEYILHHNTDLYAKHTMEDYLLVVEIGIIEDRELVLTTVENLDFTSVTIENEEFLHHGDTVVLIGTKDMKGRIMGYTIDATMRYMSVFVQEEGRWKMLSGSFSPVVHPGVLYGEPEES
ncbi:MAG: nuclear transport factor 2 family protein [Balneolaceae bacterium]|nr:MAG: nuclear transport factor 2 family protein [Balneolaceae bacterium]